MGLFRFGPHLTYSLTHLETVRFGLYTTRQSQSLPFSCPKNRLFSHYPPTMARSTPPAFHYPKPDAALAVPTIHPLILQPINPPASHKPKNPSEAWIRGNQAVPFADSGFTRSTHVIPAATPRVLTFGLSEEELPPDKEARQKRVAELSEALLSKKQALERGEAVQGLVEDGKDAPVLFNVLDRYVCTSPKPLKGNGITLVLAHANGFPRRVCGLVVSPHVRRFEYRLMFFSGRSIDLGTFPRDSIEEVS